MLIGSRQLGLAILMHEGAHRCLSRNERRNMALSQWLCAYPIFADTRAYRRYHLAHHAHTQQEDDPDLVLSAPFPITKANYRRKLWRDINYHLEHHLLFYVPCYNLPRLHATLMQGPHAARMEVQPGCLSVLRLATARPDAEDRPGAIVSNVRRRRIGARVGEDQASSGF